MSALDDFKQEVLDAQDGLQYAKWAHDNPGDLARWYDFRDAILNGGFPTPPVMTTPHGRELIDMGVMTEHFKKLEDSLKPDPTPAPTGLQKCFGVLRLGTDWRYGSGYDRYGQVCVGVGDADACAALPIPKSLVYMDYFEAAQFFCGISRADAGPYTMMLETGTQYGGQPLFDPAAPGLADALIKNIGDYLRAHKLDGFYSDNMGASLQPFSIDHTQIPTKYLTPSNWYNAVQALIIKVGAALKAQGFYVGGNVLAYFPGNVGVFPGTNSDDGSATIEWIKRLAPGLSWVMIEQWMWANNGHLRTTAIEWDDFWDKWQSVVRATQDLGLDFVATIDVKAGGQKAAVYSQASYLLDKDDNRAGGVLVNGGGIEVYDPSWARPVGVAKGPKTKSGNQWVRKFDDGKGGTITVTVDPVAATASIV